MRISHRYRFVFFASPKTGSASVRAFLNPYSDIFDRSFVQTDAANPFYSHMRPIEAKAAFLNRGWQFENYYRFVFVRNPWARAYSLYKMICNLDKGFNRSFEAWLRSSKPSGHGGGGPDTARWRKYGTYSIEKFAGDGQGGLLVDEIFRLEDIATLPKRLREKGIPIPVDATMPWTNRTPAIVNLRQHYTPELIELVAKRYANEISQFHYEFPG